MVAMVTQYGQIHLPIKDMVLDKYGQQVWKEILYASNLDEDTDFLVFQSYPDDKTFGLLKAVCQVTGASWDTVLEDFGDYFIQYCLRHGYDQLLRTLGKDFTSFIQNLDTLHSYLARTYTKLRFPSFRCEQRDAKSIFLHYLTERTGLHPLVLGQAILWKQFSMESSSKIHNCVECGRGKQFPASRVTPVELPIARIGLAKAVSRDIYNQNAVMKLDSISKHKLEGGSVREHVIFIVELQDNDLKEEEQDEQDIQDIHHSVLKAKHICCAFPYHIVFDEKLRIKQCGSMIPKLFGRSCIPPNTLMTSLFSVMHPPMDFTTENMILFKNNVFYLSVKTNGSKEKHLLLRGEMMWLKDIQHMIYISSPRLTSLSELRKLNLYLSDIPIYDVTRELILLNQQRIAEIDITKTLDETTAELKKTSRLLEEEKQRTDNLLYQMLPKRVANDLKNGLSIAAEKFESVTILFSDIVTFTNIAAVCSPMDVVNMLNDLYERFDRKTNKHDVYKVETIGDAYMVVSGAPEVKDIHAQPVANFAIDIVKEASQVKSPATGKPLKIRIGLHSGPVVAGVVGVKMPRYCLFGDTVNTASRMESHGIPGRIHVSPIVFRLLITDGYIFRDRGLLEVKGKGVLNTYFLVGRNKELMKEPGDDWNSLPLVTQPAVKVRDEQKKQTPNISGACILL